MLIISILINYVLFLSVIVQWSRLSILANAIDRPPNNCLSFKIINCTETYLKLYSHYPENAANSHTVFTFSSSSSLLEISLCISRDVF